MHLSRLLPGLLPPGSSDPDIRGLAEDSRRIRPGWLFVAVPGTAADGHAYVPEAAQRGAAAVVAERDVPAPPGVTVVRVPSSRRALAEAAARFHGDPARRLRLIGFTGTFGKTTTSEVLRALLEGGGGRVGVLGSLGARYGPLAGRPSGLTTPAPVELHRALADLARAGADTVILEVTSHALRQERVHGLRFEAGVLAALLPGEHTDFHRTFEDYVAAKRRFLGYLEPTAVLAYDADNPPARQLAGHDWPGPTAGVAVGRHLGDAAGPRDLSVTDVELDGLGALISVGGERLRSALLGRPSVRSVGLALAAAFARGLDPAIARDVLPRLQPLPRRMQRFTAAGRMVLDDTAAHPDSFLPVFEVSALLPHDRLHVVYAIRGSRGADVNRRNAIALADLVALHGASAFVVTPADESVAPTDRVSTEEADATRRALAGRGCRFEWRDRLEDATSRAAAASRPGDLIVLLGAQGMNRGAGHLRRALGGDR